MTNLNKGDIEGVIVTPLKKICDERGAIYHMIRDDSPSFERFGEIYFSLVHPGVIKGWHIHDIMALNYAVPVGKIKLVLYDERENSSTKGNLMELFLGRDNYSLVSVPPKVWNGFKGLGDCDSMVANCATHHHDSSEIRRLDPFSEKIGYDWGVKHG